jgi:tetratricopeptide (TPR) repeat protein
MKSPILGILFIVLVLAGCGGTSSLNRLPQEDRDVFSLIEKVNKNPGIVAYTKELATQYATSIAKHQQNIQQYNQSNEPEKWERIMNEYAHMEKLANTIAASPAAAKAVSVERFNDEYLAAKQNAVTAYYDEALSYLNNNDRQSAQQSYNLLQKVNKLSPGYKDVKRLMDEAYNKSILKVVINPVNYYSHNYNYWGLNNDYVQQEIVRDLKFQLSSGNVMVYSSWEANANRVNADRVVDLSWNELFLPIPRTYTTSKQVSAQIQTGETADKKPVYNTVTATIYITRRVTESHGTLSCKVYEPATNSVVLWDEFPASYNNVEEYATYRGDSRALSSYDWALINNARYRDLTRNDMFNNVFRQAYPQLLSRLRSVTW